MLDIHHHIFCKGFITTNFFRDPLQRNLWWKNYYEIRNRILLRITRWDTIYNQFHSVVMFATKLLFPSQTFATRFFGMEMVCCKFHHYLFFGKEISTFCIGFLPKQNQLFLIVQGAHCCETTKNVLRHEHIEILRR